MSSEKKKVAVNWEDVGSMATFAVFVISTLGSLGLAIFGGVKFYFLFVTPEFMSDPALLTSGIVNLAICLIGLILFNFLFQIWADILF